MMRDRLVELCREAHTKYLEEEPPVGDFGAYLADHLLKNGVIVPPCKVGDTVYELVNWCDYTNCHFEGCAGCGNCNDGGILERKFNLSHLARIGKSVFLTREEAERALRGKSDV
jgi:hypothetical protein